MKSWTLPVVMMALLISPAAEAGKRNKKAQVVEPPPPQPPAFFAAPPPAHEPIPGSLWNEVEARRLLGLDFNARNIGDLVTVYIDEQTATSLNADTATSTSSSIEAGIGAMFGLENSIAAAAPKTGGSLSLSTNRDNQYAGQGATGRGSSVFTTVTCEVLQVFPNGNLRIWGYKKVRVNRETQYVTLSGIVRQRDIRTDNTVLANSIAQAAIEVTGDGVVATKQRPGVGHRVFDAVWPF
ncbi:MAG: flagellar basal body L-ring protein FlgH [Myxococcota bacterium]